MTISLSPVANSQTFGTWLQRTNDIVQLFSTNTITVDSSLGGSVSTGNAYVNGIFGANTLYATYISGGNLTSNALITVLTNTSVNATLSIGNSSMNVVAGFLSSNLTILAATGNQNNYVQSTLTNSNTGITASGDYIVYDNGGITSSNYIDMGINSSNWSNTGWTINGPSDGYLYTGNTNLAIGTLGQSYINFFANGTLAVNEVMRITSGANVGIGNTNPNAKLQVTGTANVSGNVSIGGIGKFASDVNVSGNASITGNAYIVGTANIVGNVYLSNSIVVADSLVVPTISGNTVINGVVNVVSNNINVSVNTYFSNNVSIIGNLDVSGNLVYTGSSAGNIIPVNNSYSLGNSTQTWSLYSSNVNISSNSALIISNISTTSSLVYSFASSANAVIDQFPVATYRSAEYLIQASNSSAYQLSKVLVLHDGTTAYSTEYAIVNSSAQMLTMGVTKSGANVVLWSTPVDSSVVVKLTRTVLVV